MRRLRLGCLISGLVLVGCGAQPGVTSIPSTLPGPATTAGAGTATVPTGTWTSTITEEDLRAAGFTEVGAFAENTGTFTLTLAPDGTWTEAQTASQPIKWPVFRGTYTSTGEGIIEMHTTFPPDYAGDVVSVKLASEADGLHIRLLSPDDPLLRAHLESHVWAPSR